MGDFSDESLVLNNVTSLPISTAEPRHCFWNALPSAAPDNKIEIGKVASAAMREYVAIGAFFSFGTELWGSSESVPNLCQIVSVSAECRYSYLHFVVIT